MPCAQGRVLGVSERMAEAGERVGSLAGREHARVLECALVPAQELSDTSGSPTRCRRESASGSAPRRRGRAPRRARGRRCRHPGADGSERPRAPGLAAGGDAEREVPAGVAGADLVLLVARSNCSSAYSRVVSRRKNRPVSPWRTRLLSISDWSVSSVASQTCSAASSSKLPTNTASRVNSRCSGSLSRS